MDDLVLWFVEQLDKDTATARTATPGPWRYDQGKHHHIAGTPLFEEAVFAGPPGADAVCVAGTGETDDQQSMRDAAFIAEHDPARVLQEIDAKRQLVKLHGRAILRAGGGAQHFDTTTVCRSCEPSYQFPELSWPCPTLRLLASVYADRPGYRQEWAPTA